MKRTRISNQFFPDVFVLSHSLAFYAQRRHGARHELTTTIKRGYETWKMEKCFALWV